MKKSLLLFCMVLTGSGFLQADDARVQLRQQVSAGAALPLTTIIDRVQRSYGGRVLDIELEDDDDAPVHYEIKLLRPDGERLKLRIDPATGEALGRRDGVARPLNATIPASTLALPDRLREAARVGTVIAVQPMVDGPPGWSIRVRRSDGHEVDYRWFNEPRSTRPSSGILPLEDVLARVAVREPGRLLAVDLRLARGEAPLYHIDWLRADGRPVLLRVDARTGRW